MRQTWIVYLLPLVLSGTCMSVVRAQDSDTRLRIAELKQSVVANKQALAQYRWVEQVTISLKGEQKKQERFQVRMGPDGKPQKQSLDQPQPEQSADSRRRRGRLKEHVVEKKKEEYKDYADSIKSLIEQYVPPAKELIEQARQKGNIASSAVAGGGTGIQFTFTNYVKQGDKMAIVFDREQRATVRISIDSYLKDAKDVVTAEIQFSAIPNGPNHVSAVTINGASKELKIAIQNSDYRHL